MKEDTVIAFRQPGSFSADPLTDILRAGARRLLGQAIEAEVEEHIAAHADLSDAQGRRRVVRRGGTGSSKNFFRKERFVL
jgi:hypothetical protein